MQPVREPQQRVAHLRKNIEAASVLGATAVETFRRALPPATLQQIDNTVAVGWLPVAFDIEIYAAGERVFGNDCNRQRVAHALTETLKGTFLAPMLAAVMRVTGLDAAGSFRFAPRAWLMVYRNCGELEYEPLEPKRCRLRYVGVPPVILDASSYLEGIGAAMEGAFSVFKTTGTFKLGPIDREKGETSYLVQWR